MKSNRKVEKEQGETEKCQQWMVGKKLFLDNPLASK